MRRQRTPHEEAKPILANLATAVAGVTALGLALGFIITNAYLFSLGLIGYSISNSQYLAAGLCFLFLYLLAGLTFIIVPSQANLVADWRKMEKQRETALRAAMEKMRQRDDNYKKGFNWGFRAAFTIFYSTIYILQIAYRNRWLYGVFSVLILFSLLPSSSDIRLAFSPMMYLWTVLVTFGTLCFADILRSTPRTRLVLTPWFMVLLIVATFLYGTSLYPRISPAIGGGGPVHAILVIDPIRKKDVETILGFAIEGQKTPVLRLLFETSETYIISSEDRMYNRTVQIKKELVKGLIYNHPSTHPIENEDLPSP